MIKSYNPTIATVFGRGALSCLGEKMAELGCKNVMIVCDEVCSKMGTAQRAEDSLKAAGITSIVFDKVTPDAPDTIVDEGGDIARKGGIDGVVGIGGGSSMDTAKAIGCLLGNPGSIDQYLTEPPTFVKTDTPIVVIPTTSGTGSECTDHGVIRDTRNNRKPAVFLLSSLAIVDPELTATVPPMTTATTGLDAFTHASEAITTKNRDPRSEVMALAAIRNIAKYLPKAVADGSDMEAREGMSLAANWAGIALQDAGIHFGHSIADAFSAAFNTPHGLNCIWGSPELMKLIAPAVPDKVQLVGEALGIQFWGNETPAQIGEKTASAIRTLMHVCKIPSLSEKGYTREEVVAAAPVAFESGLKFACPVEVTLEKTKELFGAMYDNY